MAIHKSLPFISAIDPTQFNGIKKITFSNYFFDLIVKIFQLIIDNDKKKKETERLFDEGEFAVPGMYQSEFYVVNLICLHSKYSEIDKGSTIGLSRKAFPISLLNPILNLCQNAFQNVTIDHLAKRLNKILERKRTGNKNVIKMVRQHEALNNIENKRWESSNWTEYKVKFDILLDNLLLQLNPLTETWKNTFDTSLDFAKIGKNDWILV